MCFLTWYYKILFKTDSTFHFCSLNCHLFFSQSWGKVGQLSTPRAYIKLSVLHQYSFRSAVVILFMVIWTLEFVDVNPNVWPFFFFHSLFFVCLQNCSPNLRLSHWTLDPGTFQNIFVPCCDNDYSIFKTNMII